MYDKIKIKCVAATDVGKRRENNEDAYFFCYMGEKKFYPFQHYQTVSKEIKEFEIDDSSFFICAIADGMGGTNSGEVASSISLNVLQEKLQSKLSLPDNDNDRALMLRDCIISAHKAILTEAKQDKAKKGMGTTEIIGSITSKGLTVAWSGDSRMYKSSLMPLAIKDYRLKLEYMEMVSRDHSLVWDFVESGEISAEEARLHQLSHVITQSLGSAEAMPQPDIQFRSLQKGDRILLCSDGLNCMLREEDIEAVLCQKKEINEIANDFISYANEAGGHDNITVIIIDIVDIEKSNEEPIRESKKIVTSKGEIKLDKVNPYSSLLVLTLIMSIIFMSIYIYKDHTFQKFVSAIRPQDSIVINTLPQKKVEVDSKAEIYVKENESSDTSNLEVKNKPTTNEIPKDKNAIKKEEKSKAKVVKKGDPKKGPKKAESNLAPETVKEPQVNKESESQINSQKDTIPIQQ